MTQETLMTDDATNTHDSAPASQAANETPATGAGDAGQQPQGQVGEQAAEQQAQAVADQAKDNKPAGAPEQYDFKTPEGLTLDGAVLDKFSAAAKELDLPQDKAQLMLDKMAPALAQRQAEQIQAVRTEWAETSKADKEFGGEKLDESLATAKKAMDAFATPELRTLLNESGLGNHPEVIRLFYRTGKAMSEDSLVTGASKGKAQKDARSLYAASNMNP